MMESIGIRLIIPAMKALVNMLYRICYKKEYDDKDEMSRIMQQYALDLEAMERSCREKVKEVGGKIV